MMPSFLNIFKHTNRPLPKGGRTKSSLRWQVYVDSNYHYMDEDERYLLGSFENYHDAVVECKKIVDEFLSSSSVKTADELFKGYVMFGEDPWIKGLSLDPKPSHFSAREYARQRCDELLP